MMTNIFHRFQAERRDISNKECLFMMNSKKILQKQKKRNEESVGLTLGFAIIK